LSRGVPMLAVHIPAAEPTLERSGRRRTGGPDPLKARSGFDLVTPTLAEDKAWLEAHALFGNRDFRRVRRWAGDRGLQAASMVGERGAPLHLDRDADCASSENRRNAEETTPVTFNPRPDTDWSTVRLIDEPRPVSTLISQQASRVSAPRPWNGGESIPDGPARPPWIDPRRRTSSKRARRRHRQRSSARHFSRPEGRRGQPLDDPISNIFQDQFGSGPKADLTFGKVPRGAWSRSAGSCLFSRQRGPDAMKWPKEMRSQGPKKIDGSATSDRFPPDHVSYLGNKVTFFLLDRDDRRDEPSSRTTSSRFSRWPRVRAG